jgi:NADH:ubiquinone oxidoreductase subunit D
MDKKNTLLILAISVLILIAIIFYQLKLRGVLTPNFNKEINMLRSQSTSTEVGDIEKDLNETDLSNVDSELEDIEKELNTIE